MEHDRWERLQRLFHHALELPPAEREAFLEREEPDGELRGEVRALLEADAVPDALDPIPPRERLADIIDAAAESDGAPRPLEGRRIGPYRVVRRLGQGGMGAVYLAERDDVSKRVALKLVRGALGAPELIQRFLLERRVLARLDHPHIARLLDAGVTDDETPYFAMEYVEGEPITVYCAGEELPVERRLRLFRDVCDAVSYAHANLVVHRDIKPSNVMVATDGEVKLLDFGIAKLLDDDDATLTRSGARVMSPAYAAPEQRTGGAVTTATDVYALGVLLYELLTYVRPGEAGAGGGSAGASRTDRPPVADRQGLPPRPSAVRDRIGDGSGARRLSGDLDAICLRAMAVEPERRYRSALELRDDITRHLTGLPVEARLPTFRYRAGKFLRRHAAAVAGGVVLALSLGGGLGAAVWQGHRAERSRADADVARQEAEGARDQAQTALARSVTVTGFLVDLFRAADPNQSRGREVTATELVDRGVERIDELADDPPLQAQLLETLANVNIQLGRYERAAGLMRRAVDIRRALPPDSGLVSALNVLGRTFNQLGVPDSAVATFERALALSTDLLGEEHDESLALMNNVAISYGRLGRDDEAEAVFRAMIEIERRTREPHDPVRAYAMNNLGIQLTGDGRFDEAEPLLRESLQLRLDANGENDLGTGFYLDNLGMMLREAGRYDEAEPFLRRGLEIRREFLGEDHRYFAESLFSLGTLHALRAGPGDLHAADSLLQAALRIYVDALGPDNRGTAYILHSLGILEEQRGDLAAAEARFRQALEIRRDARHDNPMVTVKTFTALARILHERGSGEALGMARQGADLAERELEPSHPERTEAEGRLGLLLLASGDTAAGRDDFARGVDGLADVLGAEHPRVGRLCADARRIGGAAMARTPKACTQ